MKKGPATQVEKESDSQALAVNFELDARSRYVFRGIKLSEGPVVQPTVSLAKRGFLVSIFGNLNASRKRGALKSPRQFNEIDYTLTKTLERGRTTWDPGVVFYHYPTGLAQNTGEASLSLSRSYRQWRLFLNNSLDVVKYHGAYFGEIGASHERTLGRRATSEMTLSLGFANGKFNRANIGPDKNAFNVLGLGATLNYSLNDRFYLRPHLNFTRILDSDLRAALEDPTIWEGGVALGADF